MRLRRRQFFLSGAVLAATAKTSLAEGDTPSRPALLKPRRLRPGDTVGLVDPATATFLREDIRIVEEAMAGLGLKTKRGRNLLARRGYFAGSDAERAADVNAFFADRDVSGIVCVRGGWGCARLLPHLDFDAIRANPKVLAGYSDITALHTAIPARTGLVTFHAPVGISPWIPFSTAFFKRVVFDGEAVTMANPTDKGDALAQATDRVQTITPGIARGRLLGGNLTVLSALMGSPYLPSFDGAILFLEDVDENLYRIDRMLTTLRLAGVLSKIRGFVFGKCTECKPGEGYGSLTLEEILDDHVKPLGVPAWQGAMIGHIDKQFTVPIGVEAEIDADKGTIRLLEPAVA